MPASKPLENQSQKGIEKFGQGLTRSLGGRTFIPIDPATDGLAIINRPLTMQSAERTAWSRPERKPRGAWPTLGQKARGASGVER